MRLPGFGASVPPEPDPPPTRDDPALSEAREKERLAALRRKGRAASIKTSGMGVADSATITRPSARAGADILG